MPTNWDPWPGNIMTTSGASISSLRREPRGSSRRAAIASSSIGGDDGRAVARSRRGRPRACRPRRRVGVDGSRGDPPAPAAWSPARSRSGPRAAAGGAVVTMPARQPRSFLEDDVGVRATDTERADSGASAVLRPPAMAPARSGRRRGSRSKSISGFGVSKCSVGGMASCVSARTALMRPATPAAASVWPMLLLTEPSATFRSDRPLPVGTPG